MHMWVLWPSLELSVTRTVTPFPHRPSIQMQAKKLRWKAINHFLLSPIAWIVEIQTIFHNGKQNNISFKRRSDLRPKAEVQSEIEVAFHKSMACCVCGKKRSGITMIDETSIYHHFPFLIIAVRCFNWSIMTLCERLGKRSTAADGMNKYKMRAIRRETNHRQGHSSDDFAFRHTFINIFASLLMTVDGKRAS